MWPFKKKEKAVEPALTMQMLISLLPYMTAENKQDILKRLKSQKRPNYLCGKEVPESLNMLTYGQLDDLHDTDDEEDPVAKAAMIILDIKPEQLQDEDVNSVFGFASFVTEELERINKLFKGIKPKYSAEELRAGVEQLNFGSFGVLDWYANRQGLHNQNEVRDVPWVRIYKCMSMDNEKNLYERRLHDQYKPKGGKK